MFRASFVCRIGTSVYWCREILCWEIKIFLSVSCSRFGYKWQIKCNWLQHASFFLSLLSVCMSICYSLTIPPRSSCVGNLILNATVVESMTFKRSHFKLDHKGPCCHECTNVIIMNMGSLSWEWCPNKVWFLPSSLILAHAVLPYDVFSHIMTYDIARRLSLGISHWSWASQLPEPLAKCICAHCNLSSVWYSVIEA
jgi:hypothetical protein